MVILKNFLYCRGTRNVTQKEGEPAVTIIDGLLNALTPDFIPGNFSFSIVFSILNMDINKNCNIKISFVNEDGHEVIETEDIQLPCKPENKFNLPNEYFGYNVGIELKNVLLEKEGTYYTVVYIDGEERERYPIYAKGKKVLVNG